MKRAFALLLTAPLLLVALLFVHVLAEESKGVATPATVSASVETLSLAAVDCVDGCHAALDAAETACVFALLVGLLILGVVAISGRAAPRSTMRRTRSDQPRPPTVDLLHLLSVSRT